MSEVEQLEAELEKLQRANGDLAHRNSVLEKYLDLRRKEQPAPSVADEWWLDQTTRDFVYRSFEQTGTVTFTACESRPLKLTCKEVGGASLL